MTAKLIRFGDGSVYEIGPNKTIREYLLDEGRIHARLSLYTDVEDFLQNNRGYKRIKKDAVNKIPLTWEFEEISMVPRKILHGFFLRNNVAVSIRKLVGTLSDAQLRKLKLRVEWELGERLKMKKQQMRKEILK